MNLHTELTTFKKFNSKWIIDLNINFKYMKLLEEHIAQNLGDLGHGHNFLHTTPKLMIRIEKNDKSTFIKTVIKSLLRE